MERYNGFYGLLESQKQKFSDSPAFRYDKNGTIETITYSQWHDDVHREAERLKETGSLCTAVVCDGSYASVCVIFASVLAGSQTVLLEALQSPQERQEALQHTDAELLWLRGEYTKTGIIMPEEERSARRGRILFFTSGTTSRARAVVLTDVSLMNSAYNGGMMLAMDPSDTLLCVLPLSHVFGFVCSLLWPLSFGACTALSRGPRHYIDDCAWFRPTVVSVVPALLQFFLKYSVMNEELHTILVGAGDCPKEVLEAVKRSGRRISFGYGMTETSSGVAISIGDDPLAMAVCPDDTITLSEDGEILIQAPTCVMQGYYKDPAGTEAVLKDGILHTGDLGSFDEKGCLHILGRKKEVLVFADGTKIYLPEYEAQLAELLDTAELAVMMRQGKPVLVMQDNGMNRQEILEKIAPVIRKYSRGRQITDVLMIKEKLPRTASGKIRRWQLQKEIK